MSILPIVQKEPIGSKQTRNYLRSFGELYDRVAGTGLIPPQAIEIEQSVLGAMMIDKTAASRVIEELGGFTLIDSPFYREAHSVIYFAIVALDANGERIDLLSVTERLKLDGALEEAGGPAYLVNLTSNVVTTANVQNHARFIQEKYLARELIRINEQNKLRAFIGEEDTFELYLSQIAELSDLADIRHKKSTLSAGVIAERVRESVQRIHDHKIEVTGIPSRIDDLDEITSGWQKTDLIILAARTSQGKTALGGVTFVLNAALHPIVERRVPVAVFSLEMDSEQMLQRMACADAGVDSQDIRKGRASDGDMIKFNASLDRIKKANNIFIDDTVRITPLELRAKCRRLQQTEKIGLIVVDYIQRMDSDKNFGNDRYREITYISRSLKILAKELKVPIIVLSQLNRSLESRQDKRPMLSDLRDSGAIEEDADIVLFIYRPEIYGIEQYEDSKPTEGTAEIIVAKQRKGPIGTVRAAFLKQCGRFDNLWNHPLFDETDNAHLHIGGNSF